MFEWLVYTGGLADVEVPVDEPVGGYVIADRGKAAKFPKATADGLLEHGKNSDPDGAHDRQWRKATAEEIAAAGGEPGEKTIDEMSGKELDALAAELGVEWDAKAKVDEKKAILKAHIEASFAEEEEPDEPNDDDADNDATAEPAQAPAGEGDQS